MNVTLIELTFSAILAIGLLCFIAGMVIGIALIKM